MYYIDGLLIKYTINYYKFLNNKFDQFLVFYKLYIIYENFKM